MPGPPVDDSTGDHRSVGYGGRVCALSRLGRSIAGALSLAAEILAEDLGHDQDSCRGDEKSTLGPAADARARGGWSGLRGTVVHQGDVTHPTLLDSAGLGFVYLRPALGRGFSISQSSDSSDALTSLDSLKSLVNERTAAFDARTPAMARSASESTSPVRVTCPCSTTI